MQCTNIFHADNYLCLHNHNCDSKILVKIVHVLLCRRLVQRIFKHDHSGQKLEVYIINNISSLVKTRPRVLGLCS